MLLGTDPEFFLVDRDGKPVPAHKAGFGDKHNKMKLGAKFNQNRAFRDGYAVEVNVGAYTCRESMCWAVLDALYAIRTEAEKHNLRVIATPAVQIDLAKDMGPDAPPDVLTFGCDPSWDSYTGEVKVPQLDAMSHEWRYAGGHMHFSTPLRADKKGVTDGRCAWMLKAEDVQLFVRMLDLYVGVPLTALAESSETFRRRQFYGQSGEFRYQEYKPSPAYPNGCVGVEYRTPGPEVWASIPTASLAFGQARTIALGFETYKKNWDAGIEKDVRAAIDTGKNVRELVREHGLLTKRAWDHVMSKREQFLSLKFETGLDLNAESKRGWDYLKSTL